MLAALASCTRDDTQNAPVLVDLGAADAEIAALVETLVARVQAAPADAQRHGQLGMAYEVNGFAQAALESYERAEALDPRDPVWPYYAALLVAHRGDLERALDLLDRSIELDGGYVPAWLWRGTWLLDLGRPAEAAAAFERAAGGEPQAASVGLARAALAEGRASDAAALLEPFAESGEASYVLKLLAQTYARLGREEDARSALARVTGPGIVGWGDPRSAAKRRYEASLGAKLASARALLGNGRAGEALELIEPLRADHPTHQGLLTVLAECYRQTGRAAAAREVLVAALAAHPDHVPFHLNLASLYVERGDYPRAVPHLERAIALDPTAAWAHAQLGLAAVERGDLDAARAAFAAALEHDPGDATVNYYWGMVDASLGRWADAEARFLRAMTLDPGFAQAQLALAQTLVELRRYDDARAALARAARLGAPAPDVQTTERMIAARQRAQ